MKETRYIEGNLSCRNHKARYDILANGQHDIQRPEMTPSSLFSHSLASGIQSPGVDKAVLRQHLSCCRGSSFHSQADLAAVLSCGLDTIVELTETGEYTRRWR
jgi:hypothetical protein